MRKTTKNLSCWIKSWLWHSKLELLRANFNTLLGRKIVFAIMKATKWPVKFLLRRTSCSSCFYVSVVKPPTCTAVASFLTFLDHTQFRHISLVRTPLDVGSVRLRHTCLTTHGIQKKQTSMPLVGFEPAVPTSELPQTDVLFRHKFIIKKITSTSQSVT